MTAAYSAERLLDAFAKVPAHVAVLRGPDHVYAFVNDSFGKVIGIDEPIGKTVRRLSPRLQRSAQGLDRPRLPGSPRRSTSGSSWPAISRRSRRDPAQIQQIVMNLVINGAEAMGDERGTVVVTTGVRDVDASAAASFFAPREIAPGRYVSLEVHDTGSGMDAATQAKIFDPFFSTKFTGRGLGLAAVLGIIRAHRGAINVYSEPGKGTTFKVFLAAAAGVPERRESLPADAFHGSGLALVIDDELQRARPHGVLAQAVHPSGSRALHPRGDRDLSQERSQRRRRRRRHESRRRARPARPTSSSTTEGRPSGCACRSRTTASSPRTRGRRTGSPSRW